MVCREIPGCRSHNRQHIPDLQLPASRKNGNKWLVRQVVLFSEGLRVRQGIPAVDGIQQRMPGKCDIYPEFFVKFLFKWQYDQHFVDIPPDGFYARLLPGPYLGRNVIDGANAVFAGEFRHAQVKAGIVDQNENIRSAGKQIFLTKTDQSQYTSDILQYLYKTHIVKIPVMPDQNAPPGLHPVATPAPEFGFPVQL